MPVAIPSLTLGIPKTFYVKRFVDLYFDGKINNDCVNKNFIQSYWSIFPNIRLEFIVQNFLYIPKNTLMNNSYEINFFLPNNITNFSLLNKISKIFLNKNIYLLCFRHKY